MNIRQISLLIVEDSKSDCNNFLKALENRTDINLISITDSDIEALKIVRFKRPDAIILDVELNNSTTGNPDSFGFLEQLNSGEFEDKPLIIVNTHLKSEKTCSLLHKLGADLVLYKDQHYYSAEYVLNTVLKYISPDQLHSNSENVIISNESNTQDLLNKQIETELDFIGLSYKMTGRQYAHDAILYLIQTKNHTPQPIGVVQHLVKLYGKSPATITNGIQNSINRAWKHTNIDDLELHYTGKVNYETGSPTTMDFLFYYVNKISKLI